MRDTTKRTTLPSKPVDNPYGTVDHGPTDPAKHEDPNPQKLPMLSPHVDKDRSPANTGHDDHMGARRHGTGFTRPSPTVPRRFHFSGAETPNLAEFELGIVHRDGRVELWTGTDVGYYGPALLLATTEPGAGADSIAQEIAIGPDEPPLVAGALRPPVWIKLDPNDATTVPEVFVRQGQTYISTTPATAPSKMLPLAGGRMKGAIKMGGHDLTEVRTLRGGRDDGRQPGTIENMKTDLGNF